MKEIRVQEGGKAQVGEVVLTIDSDGKVEAASKPTAAPAEEKKPAEKKSEKKAESKPAAKTEPHRRQRRLQKKQLRHQELSNLRFQSLAKISKKQA